MTANAVFAKIHSKSSIIIPKKAKKEVTALEIVSRTVTDLVRVFITDLIKYSKNKP